jgi:AraC family transcriptional regulator of adaptative response/methylated-DNA-[protein]-cysteine methyltransferase
LSLEEDMRIDPEVAWAAVLARDARYDGALYYAVRTTGVFCRPVCRSRRPHRRNVEFFTSTDAARDAGYRACRRCRPTSTEKPAMARAIDNARAYLDAHADENITLDVLSHAVHVSPFHLQREFKKRVGLTPREYQRAQRAERLRTELKNGGTVIQAAFEAGYSSGSRLYDDAPSSLGMTPATYRKGGAGATIEYAIVPCALGKVLVAATARGVCMVSMGDAEAALLAALRAEYPEAQLAPACAQLRGWIAAITAYLAGHVTQLDLPVDVHATVFQTRVWKALREIPYGESRSYADIARAVDAPTATRAVARACATNPVALVIPCHRVVSSSGAAGGYRWGVERKRRLLETEGRATATATARERSSG